MRKRNGTVAAAAGAFLLLLAAYSNYFGNAFHFDDSHVVVNNLYLRSLKNVPEFFTNAETGTSLPANAGYRPLVTLSLALDYARAGSLDARTFHVTQFCLLVVLGLMLFFFFRRIMAEVSPPGTSNDLPAVFATALFCLHTANTETLNIISARSELISALGILGSFLLYLRGGWPQRSGLFLVPMALGALAKVPAVMFAPLLFVFVVLFEPKRPWAAAFRKTWPVFLLGVFLFWFVESMNGPSILYATLGRLEYARTQPFVWLHYLKLFFLPVGLTADTDWSVLTSWIDSRFFAGMAFVLALAVLIAFLWKRGGRALRPVVFGLVWFAVALLPSSSAFPLSEVANEHRIFLPYMGLSLAFAWSTTLLIRSSVPQGRRPPKRPSVGMILGGAAALMVLGAHAWGAHERNKVWLNDETLWTDVIAKSPVNGRAWMNYGLSQMSRGRMEKARDAFEKAKTYTPNYPHLETNLGIVYSRLEPDKAEGHFRRALEINPQFASGHYFFGRWLVEQGRGPEAIVHLKESLRLSPALAEPRRALMDLYAARGDEEALSGVIREALAISPGDAEAQAFAAGRPIWMREIPNAASLTDYERGLWLLGRKRYADAAQAFRRAVNAHPDSAESANNLGWSLAKLGFYGDAVPWFERAIAKLPSFELAKNNLRWVRPRVEPGKTSGNPGSE